MIGIGTLSGMLVIREGQLETRGTMLHIFSLVLGSLGEWLDIEKRMDTVGGNQEGRKGGKG